MGVEEVMVVAKVAATAVATAAAVVAVVAVAVARVAVAMEKGVAVFRLQPRARGMPRPALAAAPAARACLVCGLASTSRKGALVSGEVADDPRDYFVPTVTGPGQCSGLGPSNRDLFWVFPRLGTLW